MEFLLSEPGEDPIIVESWFRASPDRVYRAWTSVDEVLKWFGYHPNFLHAAEIDLRPGGAWRFAFPPKDELVAHGFEGVYVEIDPVKRLVFTWRRFERWRDGAEAFWPYSQVDVAFAPKGAGTQLRVVHSSLSDQEKRQRVGVGWTASFANLQALMDDAAPPSSR